LALGLAPCLVRSVLDYNRPEDKIITTHPLPVCNPLDKRDSAFMGDRTNPFGRRSSSGTNFLSRRCQELFLWRAATIHLRFYFFFCCLQVEDRQKSRFLDPENIRQKR